MNRVNPETLKTWSNSHDAARIERSLRHIEREREPQQVPGHRWRLERELQAPDPQRSAARLACKPEGFGKLAVNTVVPLAGRELERERGLER